ncbi:MAG: TrkA C-terminal domain-containing protein [Candidatus Calescibacterium sp.]|nr:potassium transporter TrkA [Candidatus Calescibacterium sp.]MCX7971746.1 potassium transporter TrkA [bacterium]MDW8195352.1 TrkA C-terminal domain-containing protein [Candidatus Calescibacterium sp.]
MIPFEEIDLPGIGRKYVIKTYDKEIQVIVYETGIKQVYFVKDDEVVFEFTLTSEEAKRLGLILTEAFYQTVSKDKLEYIQDQLIFEWIKISDRSPFVGRTLSDLEVRKKTGASVVAVIRGKEFFPNPDPYSFKFLPNDTIICIGNRKQLKDLEKYINHLNVE